MIEVSHVSRNFGTFRAVNDISFSIPTGQIVGLLGPNGAGKTTTMRMITGFLSPSEGKIFIDGKDISENPVEAKKMIGYMPESAPLYSDMIVEDYLTYVAKMHNLNPEEKVPLLCKECGLKEVMSKNINELSRGNRQRVSLAHALMNDPQILILDEPTSGLDPNQVEDVRNIIRDIGKTRTVIVSTHILSEVETLCNNVIIISGGKVVANSPTEELRESFGNKVAVKLTVGGADFKTISSALKNVKGVLSVSKTDADDLFCKDKASGILLNIDGKEELRPEIVKIITKNKWFLYEMAVRKNSLEDVFHALTNEEKTGA
jgi:ABC-2 type transport system ATP-binding protein